MVLIVYCTVETLLSKGTIEKVEDRSSPGFYNYFSVVPKRDGGHRPCFRFIHPKHSSPDGKVQHPYISRAASTLATLEPQKWTTTIDSIERLIFRTPN